MKKIIFKSIIGLVSFVVLIFGWNFFIYYNPGVFIKMQLVLKNLENPELDAIEDINDGNAKCYAIRRLATDVPGIENKDQWALCKKLGIKYIKGTSDGLMNDYHIKTQIQAADYAYGYNLAILANYKLQN